MNPLGFLLLLLTSVAFAQGDGSALAGIRLLPKEAAKRLVRIEAREGTPSPERWYFIVHDPQEQRGVREFVVAGGKVVASRTLSQFVDTLQPGDVIGGEVMKVDSTQVIRLADLYATANGKRVGSLNYQLHKDSSANAVVWNATVLDSAGDQIGSLTVHASKGTVVRFDGFENAPSPDQLAPAPAAAAQPVVAAQTASVAPPPKAKVVTPAPTPRPPLLKRFFGSSDPKTKKPSQ